MGKLKNWSKQYEMKNRILYVNDKTHIELMISSGGNVWTVRLGEREPRFFFSKKNALAYAINYMRRHPNG